jgi:hypothetical protein
MLFRSGDNLSRGVLDFIDNSKELTLYSAYIKTNQLIKLNKDGKITRIVVRWEIKDLHQGSSDLDLYHYCVDNRIALYRNSRIHLKCLRNNEDDVFLGSANFTGRGIGEVPPAYNLELNALSRNISLVDALYLDKIISQSEYMTEELFQKIEMLLANLPTYKSQDDVYSSPDLFLNTYQGENYLISDLPMFYGVERLYESAHNYMDLDSIQKQCLSHDIAIYGVDIFQSQRDFYDELKVAFNSHVFINKLKEEVKKNARKSLNYGSIIRWIRENTKTVPTPISWELKEQQVVNVLFDWICYFDRDFYLERPGYSQILRFGG